VLLMPHQHQQQIWRKLRTERRAQTRMGRELRAGALSAWWQPLLQATVQRSAQFRRFKGQITGDSRCVTEVVGVCGVCAGHPWLLHNCE
jgi:hypothetical protein